VNFADWNRRKKARVRTAVAALNLDFVSWRADWAWGLPLIVLTVVIHVLTLGLIDQRGVKVFSRNAERRNPLLEFVAVMGTTTMCATTLHAFEAGIWAVSYRVLGALPDFKSAMLYSINAITSYGHENLVLQSHWQLLRDRSPERMLAVRADHRFLVRNDSESLVLKQKRRERQG
jgi:hypothetical protein